MPEPHAGAPSRRSETTRERRSTSSGSTGSRRTRCTAISAPTDWRTRTRAIEEHGGGVFALAHFGSWDVAAGCGLASGLRVTAVMAPVGNDLVTRIAAWARRRQDLEVLVSSNAARGLIKAVRRGRFAAILSDIPDRGETVVVDFCGGRVAFSTAAAWLGAGRQGAGAAGRLLAISRALPPGRPPAGRRSSPADTDAEVTQRIATGLEAAIRRAPEWWYPFGDIYEV